MITILENKSKKSVGRTSLFISFDYTPKIVDIVKSAENAIYDKNNRVWELPLNKLSYLIDNLTYEDDIQLFLLPDEQREELSPVITHKIPPFDYQNDGIKWLINRDSGLLTDCPGLGKTLQVIYAAEELKVQKDIQHCLIICGINTLKQNWKKEINKFSTLSARIIGERINSKGNVTYSSIKDRAEELYNKLDEFFIIINIESLRDSLVLDAIMSSQNNFDMIVLDECHKIKDPTSAQGKSLLKLNKVGKYHFGLTGTLLVNSPLDSYSALKFIGEEKGNFTNFKKFYCVISQRFGHYQIDGYQNIDILKQEIDGCSLRRTKDLLNLPEKIIIPEYIELNTTQANFYQDIQAGVVAEADRVNIKNTTLLGLIVRLRQATSSPETLTSTPMKNTKLERACELVDEIVSNGEKVVIFSSFKEPIYKLFQLLKPYNPIICTGDQSEQDVSDAIDTFQSNSENKVFLGTVQKMSTGITLTAASYMIFIDTPWTYAEFEQACDRIHRIGTSKTVMIYDLIAKDTIDERVYDLVNMKKGISDYMIDNKVGQTEELKMLLGIQ